MHESFLKNYEWSDILDLYWKDEESKEYYRSEIKKVEHLKDINENMSAIFILQIYSDPPLADDKFIDIEKIFEDNEDIKNEFDIFKTNTRKL